MSRNGSGTMSVVNSLTSGTTITAAAHNQNYSDIAAELTNSVAVDGQSTMTGQFKAASGTVAAPGIAFGSDTDSGLYRIGANEIGVAVNGAKVVDVSTTGATVTGIVDATAYTQAGVSLIPIGLGPLQWTGRTAPAKWVLAGATYLRATYPDLWTFAAAEIAAGNTFYTNGNGSTTFTIAAMDGYAPVGVDAAAARIASITHVGDTAGAATHALTALETPNISSANSNNVVITTSVPNAAGSTGTTGANIAGTATTTSITVAPGVIAVSSTNTGGVTGQAHSIVQPVRAFNYIIYAGA